MNKNIFLVLVIIFMVIVVTGTGGWLTSSAWADGIESGGIQKVSDGDYQADDRIILLTGIGEDEGENVSQPEVKIMVEEIDNGSEKQPYYDILVDLDTEYTKQRDGSLTHN